MSHDVKREDVGAVVVACGEDRTARRVHAGLGDHQPRLVGELGRELAQPTGRLDRVDLRDRRDRRVAGGLEHAEQRLAPVDVIQRPRREEIASEQVQRVDEWRALVHA